MIDFFRDLEERLLRAEVRRSSDEAGKLLASDFTEFGSSGAVYSRQQTLDALAKKSPMELSATDFSVRVLCDDVVLVTYRAASEVILRMKRAWDQVWTRVLRPENGSYTVTAQVSFSTIPPADLLAGPPTPRCKGQDYPCVA
jgi:hypothetical protein